MLILSGIKINDLALLDAGGFDRSLIASRAIEAYLIQVVTQINFNAFQAYVFDIFVKMLPAEHLFADSEDWVLSCGPTSW
jgi:hypothetical protein